MKRTLSNCNSYHDLLGRFTDKNNAHTIVPCCGSGPETPSKQSRQQISRQKDQPGRSKPEYTTIYPSNKRERNVECKVLMSPGSKNKRQDQQTQPGRSKPEYTTIYPSNKRERNVECKVLMSPGSKNKRQDQQTQSDSPTQGSVVVPVQQVTRNIQSFIVAGDLSADQKRGFEKQKEIISQPKPEPIAKAPKEVIKVEAAEKKYTFTDLGKDATKGSAKWVLGCDWEKLEENKKRLEELRNQPGGWAANKLEVAKLKASSLKEVYGLVKRIEQFKNYIHPPIQQKGSFSGRGVLAPNQPAKSITDAMPSPKGRAGLAVKAGIVATGILAGEKFSKDGETPKKYNIKNLAYDLAKELTFDWDTVKDNTKRLKEIWSEPGGLSANKAEVIKLLGSNLLEVGPIIVPFIKAAKVAAKVPKRLNKAIKIWKNLNKRTAAHPSSPTETPRVKQVKSSPTKDTLTREATTTTTTKKTKNDLFKGKRIETTQGANRVDHQKKSSPKPKTNAKNLDSRKAKAPKEAQRRHRFAVSPEKK